MKRIFPPKLNLVKTKDSFIKKKTVLSENSANVDGLTCFLVRRMQLCRSLFG